MISKKPGENGYVQELIAGAQMPEGFEKAGDKIFEDSLRLNIIQDPDIAECLEAIATDEKLDPWLSEGKRVQAAMLFNRLKALFPDKFAPDRPKIKSSQLPEGKPKSVLP